MNFAFPSGCAGRDINAIMSRALVFHGGTPFSILGDSSVPCGITGRVVTKTGTLSAAARLGLRLLLAGRNVPAVGLPA